MKPLPYYLHVKAKVLADFQICISVPLKLHRLETLKVALKIMLLLLCGDILLAKLIFARVNFLGGKYPGVIFGGGGWGIALGSNFPGAIIQEKFSFLSFITNTALKLLKISL